MLTLDILFKLLHSNNDDLLDSIKEKITVGYSPAGAFASCGIDMRYYQLLNQNKFTDERCSKLFNSIRGWREDYHGEINRKILSSRDMKAIVQLKALDMQYGTMPSFDDGEDSLNISQWNEPVKITV